MIEIMHEVTFENPYRGANFFSFLFLFCKRLILFCTGGLSLDLLATDEIQIFVLTALAISCSLLGVFLVLKKMAMLANALSHTILIGIISAYLMFVSVTGCCFIDLKILFVASIVSAFLTAFCTEGLQRVFRLQTDASIGLVFTALFALGVILVTLFTRNVHIGVESVMGNVDALHKDDLILSLKLLGMNGALLILLYPRYLLISFDEIFAKTARVSVVFFNYLFLLQVAATSIAAFRAVGVILVLAFFVIPFLIARLLAKNIRKILLLAPVIASFLSLVAVAFSRHMLSSYGISFSTGAFLVLLLGSLYLILAWKSEYRVKRRGFKERAE